MRARRGYTYGGRTFQTKDAVLAYLRTAWKAGRVPDDMAPVLLDLLELHPNVDQKVGCGVRRFYVGMNTAGRPCFWIERSDGTETDFSVMKCLYQSHPMVAISAAARTAVRDQIVRFKMAELGRAPFCAVTGVPLTWQDSHVDHVGPRYFRLLLLQWCQSTQADLSVAGNGDGEVWRRFADERTSAEWADFHYKHAELRLVHWQVNLSDLRRLERVPTKGVM